MKQLILTAAVVLTTFAASAQVTSQSSAPQARTRFLPGYPPGTWTNLPAIGRMPNTNELRLAIGLPLRDPAGLEQFLFDVYNPASPNYRKFLTPDELAARFGPSEADYAAVKEFARTNGFVITAEHPNRMVLDVLGRATDVGRAFHVQFNRFKHPTEARDFFAPDAEPSVSAQLPVADVQGLTDYYRPRPHSKRSIASNISPRNGSSPDGKGEYFGDDFRKAYAAGTTNAGAGQIVGLLQFDGFYTNDILSYARAAGGGRTNIPIQVVLLDGFNGTPTTGANSGNGEVSLDIEMSMAMAPGLAKIVVFEAGPNGFQNDILSSMLTFSNSIKQLSSSWGWSGGPTNTTDNLFQLIAAAGQSFFNASGDSDAFVAGSNNDVDKTTQVNAPSSCPYITQVGGTELTNGVGGVFVVESVWNDRTVNPNGGNWGSSGGISTYYGIPWWQTNVSMVSNGGSTTKRNIPDVALTANNVYSTYDNGSAGNTGGTSCAAPLWAGYMALVNQQAAANGGPPVGFLNPAVYALANTASYTNCFHDTKLGDNSWSKSAGKFAAVAGYDLATGLGSPNGVNLINALAPPGNTPPAITTAPASQTNGYGATATFAVAATGTSPLAYQWYFTNAIGGATNATLVVSSLVASNAGNYFAVVTNAYGSATSGVAALTVILTPVISQSPQSQSVLVGQSASFSVTASGAPPLAYQWRVNSNSIAGANATNYVIAAVADTDAGSYDVVVTNFSGSVTSSVAVLTAFSNLPPTVTTSPANGVGVTTATLNGSLNPNGQSTTAEFEYGLTTSYGAIVPLAGTFTGNSSIAVGTNLTGLAAGTTYHFRLDATNAGGLTLGADQSFVTVSNSATGSNSYTGVLAGWDMSGLSGYGPSPMAPTTNAPNIIVTGLTRGGGVGTNGNAAARAWGGNSFTSSSQSAAVTAGQFATFGFTANPGYILSFTNVSKFDYRRSSSGATSGALQYQVGGGAFTNIITLSYSSSSSSGASIPVPIDLSGIAALQNIPAGTNVTFRIVNWGATTSGGNWYLYDTANSAALDFAVSGSLTPLNPVVAAPSITVPPVATNVFAGKNAAFSVTAAGGGTLNYQWLKDGNAISDGATISGSQTNLLNFTPAQTNDAGGYSVIITNLGGSLTSSVAALTVAPLPLLVLSNGSGGLALSADGGAVGSAFIIQRSTNLVPPIVWETLLTDSIGTNGQIRFTDTNQNFPAGFYRIQIP